MKLKGIVIAAITALLIIFCGNGIALTPVTSDYAGMGHPTDILQAASQNPQLIVDGTVVDLSQLLNSEIPLFGSSETVVFPQSMGTMNHGEKRVQVTLNNASLELQFLNAAVSKKGDSFSLRFDSQAQAALVVVAPTIEVANDFAVDVTTQGQGNKRVCFLMDLAKRDGRIVIEEMRRVNFPGKTAQHTFLVSGASPLAADKIPAGLVAIPKTVPAYQSKQKMELNQEAAIQLERMLVQAKHEGVGGFVLTSTYRPYAYQSMLFKNKVKQVGSEAKAATIVARPGTSEHQSGLAIDFSVRGESLSKGFAGTPQGNWLANNGWRYGFILRYPADKTGITKIIYEPWHFRYIGYPYSKIIQDRKLCLEEFVSNLGIYGFYAVSDNTNTYFCALNQSDGKLYLSEPLPRIERAEAFSGTRVATMNLQ